jgi:hypothetical protein
MGDYNIKTHMFVVNIGGCDIMLWASWLHTLGPITMDFKELHISFVKDSHIHTLKGHQVGPLVVISSHRMEKLLNKGNFGIIGQLHAIQALDNNPPKNIPNLQ